MFRCSLALYESFELHKLLIDYWINGTVGILFNNRDSEQQINKKIGSLWMARS